MSMWGLVPWTVTVASTEPLVVMGGTIVSPLDAALVVAGS